MQKTPTKVREIETTTMPNGVRVISETMPHVRSGSVGLWVGNGSRCESPEQNGLSHFIEHMVFKGTSKRSAEDIARSVDSIGGNLCVLTTQKIVLFYNKVLAAQPAPLFVLRAGVSLH